MSNAPLVLIVGADHTLAEADRIRMLSAGLRAAVTLDLDEAVVLTKHGVPDAILFDACPFSLETLRYQLQRLRMAMITSVPIVICSFQTDISRTAELLQATDFLRRTLQAEEMGRIMRAAIDHETSRRRIIGTLNSHSPRTTNVAIKAHVRPFLPHVTV